MINNDIVYSFLSSAKFNNKRIQITCSGRTPQKGYVQDVTIENNVVTLNVDGEIYVMDMNECRARTTLLDRRVIIVEGEEIIKFKMG